MHCGWDDAQRLNFVSADFKRHRAHYQLDRDDYAVVLLFANENTRQAGEGTALHSDLLASTQEGIRLGLYTVRKPFAQRVDLALADRRRNSAYRNQAGHAGLAQYREFLRQCQANEDVSGKQWKLHSLLAVAPAVDLAVRRKEGFDAALAQSGMDFLLVPGARLHHKPTWFVEHRCVAQSAGCARG